MAASFFLPKSTSSEPSVAPKSEAPWVEKYRPKSVDDVAHQDEVILTLKKSIETANLPHLLFYGPPGTGKTSTILAIARQLYGTMMQTRVLELNASDERGIRVVREKVKVFARATSSTGGVPYKLVILDEADSMTPEAQAALRRTMETYSKVTRFCLICNYVSRIIEPLASRCAKFRFRPLTRTSMDERLTYICQQEGVPVSQELLDAVSSSSGGDMRRAITLLQSVYRLQGDKIDPNTVIEVSGRVPPALVSEFIQVCASNDFGRMQACVTNLVQEGYSAAQLVSQVCEAIIADESIIDIRKARICAQLGEADYCLSDGADEFLQLLRVGSNTMGCLCGQV